MASEAKNLIGAKTQLRPNETIVHYISGLYEGKVLGEDMLRTGVLCATETRLLFYGKKMFGYDTQSISYEKISSFLMNKGFWGQKLVIHASGADIKVGHIHAKNFTSFFDFVQDKISNKSAGIEERQAPKSFDASDQLRKLAQLRDDGLISEEEFSSKKKEILKRM